MTDDTPRPDEDALLEIVQNAMPETFGPEADCTAEGKQLVERLCTVYQDALRHYAAGDTDAPNRLRRNLDLVEVQLSMISNPTHAGLGTIVLGLRPRLDRWLASHIQYLSSTSDHPL